MSPFLQLADPLAIGQVLSGPTGTHVTITGADFPLSDTTCTISTPSSGSFITSPGAACTVFPGKGLWAGFNNVTGSFTVGNVPEGQYIIQVSTSPSGQFAQAIFNVTAGPFIQLTCASSPSCGAIKTFVGVGQVASGPTGSHVYIEGSQFSPNDVASGTCSLSSPSGGSIIVGGACSFFKTPNGWVNVTGSFIVGNVQNGQYVIQVSGSSGDFAQAIFNVARGAVINLIPATGPTGTHVSFEGTFFLSSDTMCTVSSPSGGTIIQGAACSVFTVSSGPLTGYTNVTGSFIVGNVQNGQYVIQVSGNQGDFAQAIFNVARGAVINLIPAKGPTGTHVSFEGTFFLSTDTTCTVSSHVGW